MAECCRWLGGTPANIAVDNQIDDGQSRSGQVRARAAAGNAAIGAGVAAEANFQETGVLTYVVCRAI